MDWVKYFVYHYVDLLDHWKMSSWLFSSSLLVPTRMTTLSRGDSSFEVSNQSHLCRRSEASKSLQASTRCISPNPPLRSEQPRRKRRLNSGLPGGAPLGVGNLGYCTFGQHYWYDTTISYLLMSPRWPLTGIIYQLYAPDLGIQSWICINLDGHGRHFTCPYPSSIGYTSQNRAINSILDVSEWIASEVICWACHWWVDMCSWGWQVRPKSMLNLVEELGQMKSAEWECTCGLWISIVEQVCCCHFG